jgi:hypothetical protein
VSGTEAPPANATNPNARWSDDWSQSARRAFPKSPRRCFPQTFVRASYSSRDAQRAAADRDPSRPVRHLAADSSVGSDRRRAGTRRRNSVMVVPNLSSIAMTVCRLAFLAAPPLLDPQRASRHCRGYRRAHEGAQPAAIPSPYEELEVVFQFSGEQFTAAALRFRTKGFIGTVSRTQGRISSRIEHRSETVGRSPSSGSKTVDPMSRWQISQYWAVPNSRPAGESLMQYPEQADEVILGPLAGRERHYRDHPLTKHRGHTSAKFRSAGDNSGGSDSGA